MAELDLDPTLGEGENKREMGAAARVGAARARGAAREVPSDDKWVDQNGPAREAKWWYSTFHTVTAMVGAGVLSLPYAMAYLGWGPGTFVLALSWCITLNTMWQMIQLHECVPGVRFDRYKDLGSHAFGPRLGPWIVLPQQLIVQVGCDIVYMVTGGKCLRKFMEIACTNCTPIRQSYWICIFGGVHFFLSQLPDFNSVSGVSLAAAIMSLSYSTIAWVGSLSHGQVPDVSYKYKKTSGADQMFRIFNALGQITFAYAGHAVVLEIQATIPSTPEKPSRIPMWKGAVWAYFINAICYFPVALIGYWAFGHDVADNVLVALQRPGWLIASANLMVVVHVIGSYQGKGKRIVVEDNEENDGDVQKVNGNELVENAAFWGEVDKVIDTHVSQSTPAPPSPPPAPPSPPSPPAPPAPPSPPPATAAPVSPTENYEENNEGQDQVSDGTYAEEESEDSDDNNVDWMGQNEGNHNSDESYSDGGGGLLDSDEELTWEPDYDKGRCPIFDPETILNPGFELEQIFTSKSEFRQVVHSHAINTMRNIKITANDTRRIYAKCVAEGCEWRLHALKLKDDDAYQIREYEPNHNSGSNTHSDLRRQNLGSPVILKQSEESDSNGKKKFQSSYVGLKPLRDGFLAACRPFIGVDGTWLKGPHTGILLTAVGVNPNNSLYNIAYAIIQSAENRFCVKHLVDNMQKAGYKDLPIEQVLWSVARATTVPDFEKKFKKILDLNEGLKGWMKDKPPHQWSRSHFSPYSKCDAILNSICETLNGNLMEARERPILTCLEWIGQHIMVRFQQLRDKAKKKWEGQRICPRIMKILEKRMKSSVNCIPLKSNDWHFEIHCSEGEQCIADLRKHTCSCRSWDLSGIPCNHAMSAISFMVHNPLDYVNPCYSVETFHMAYKP
ncbi:hypothetical protein RD792_011494 [Penstemon davidsonii]|uniref:SWIM-type domain-containing protein n=1 Tax=Penstemon davidsonii TaxID=160366 RepID=A0ABR0D6J0_9LAMI|nr:hypothetical protein RD792_011494 [Penstemon davidsonii]